MKKVVILVLFGIMFLLVLGVFAGGDTTQIEEESPVLYERTASTDTYKNPDGTYIITIYSRTINVYEDNEWKRVEDARSLKNGGFNIVYLENDPDFKINVIDFNYTFISMYLNFTGNWRDYPEYCNENNGEISCKFKLEEKYQEWNETIEDYDETEIEYEQEFEWEEGQSREKIEFKYLDNPFGRKFKFGGNSTIITLNDGNVTEDTFVKQTSPTSQFGGATIMSVDGGTGVDREYTYIQFDFSSIPSNKWIKSANLSLFLLSKIGGGGGGTAGVGIYNVFTDFWTESGTTWNSQPCDANFTDSVNCNLTFEYYFTWTDENNEFINFSVTHMLFKEYLEGDNELSMILNNEEGRPEVSNFDFATKEETVSPNPRLIVEYVTPVELITPTNNTFNSSLTADFNCSLTSGVYPLKNITSYIWNATTLELVNITEVIITGSTKSSNFTIILPQDNVYEWNCYTCDILNNCIFADNNFTLTLDTILPNINLTSPINNTNTTNNGLEINYTVSDTNLETCWYSNDSFSENTTISCGTNITITWIDGTHDLTIWANDSANNQNSSSVNFTIDTTPPNLVLAEPQAINYANNNTIYINYTTNDTTLLVDTCWFKVDLISPPLNAIDNTTITDCLNTTFSLPGGDEDYTLTFWVNDTLNNINTTTRNFGIRTNVPAINLESPTDNQFLNNKTIYFNFTATDNQGLSKCELWGNWTGSFEKNFTWTNPTNATQNFTTVNITGDAKYKWNVNCTDILNNDAFAGTNFTFTLDTTFPNLTIDVIIPVGGLQTFNFNSTAQDINLDSCKYSIFDSTGAIDGTNENVSFNCNTLTSATATEFATFNLTIYALDLAGNENLSRQLFTLVPSQILAIGGGGGTVSQTPKIAIKQPLETILQDNLKRAIIFSRMFEICGNHPDVIGECSLNQNEKEELIQTLSEQTVDLTLEELELWLLDFNKRSLEDVLVSIDDAKKFNLFIGGIKDLEFSVSPAVLDRFFFPIFSTSTEIIVTPSKTLKSCEVISGELGWDCRVEDSIAVLTFEIQGEITTRTSEATISYTSIDDENAFQSVNLRIISNRLLITVVGIVVSLVIVGVFFRKRIQKSFKKSKLKNLFK